MARLVVSKGKIEFQPSGGWNWDGWDGKLDVSAEDRSVQAASDPGAVNVDLQAAVRRLIGKSYKAQGFDSVPGSVAAAVIQITSSTLSNIATIAGLKAAKSDTRGDFRVSVVPSLKIASSTIPDPLPMHSGTWRIVEDGQNFVITT